MTLSRSFYSPFPALSLIFLLLALLPAIASATSETELNEKYEEIEDSLFENAFDLPIHLESTASDHHMQGVVYGVIYHPFETVRHSLAKIQNWCEIMPLHLNIKACTYSLNDHCKVTFYSGRKFYEKADDVYQLKYDFSISTNDEQHFHATLSSQEGPIDTEDYLITVEANPLTDGSTFFKMGYEYKYGFWTQLAMSTYFATLGRKKIGFTVIETDKKGNPVYVDGVRGVIERNSIRYYFAISTFFDSLKEPTGTRFDYRLDKWFDLTEKYHTQLYEMDKADYVRYKQMERSDQNRLQSILVAHKANNHTQSPLACNN